MHENARFLVDFLTKIVPGFFVVVSSYILYVILHFWGPAVPPPQRGPKEAFPRGICDSTQNKDFSRANWGVRSITARESSGMHDSGSRKIAPATCVPLFLQCLGGCNLCVPLFLQCLGRPNSCVPLFFAVFGAAWPTHSRPKHSQT